MFKGMFVLSLAVLVTVLVTKDAMSAPQIGGQFGSISNNNTGGGSGGSITPYGEMNNRTETVPGGGYGGEYASHHSNDTAPTSPSMGGGSYGGNMNSTVPTSTCECGQMGNAPTGGPSDAAGATPPGNPSDAASGSPAGNPSDAASGAPSSPGQ